MLVYLSLGPILWAIHLTLIYGTHTLVCARTIPGTLPLGFDTAPFVILLITVTTLAVLLGAVLLPSPNTRPFNGSLASPSFFRRVMVLLALLSAFGVGWAGLASMVVQSC
jgi:hypothetical protein